MLKDSKQARIDFLEQLEMKRKYFKSSYQTSNPVKEVKVYLNINFIIYKN